MRKIAIYLSLSLLVNVGTYSQKSPEKFGKNIEEHLESEVCPIDSSAGAYVIFDHCFVDFDYDNLDGFYWELDRHIRIKILDKSELDQATFSIPIYEHARGEEKVLNLKAVSYNLKDGKIIESKIGQKESITEERSEYWNLFKFALKNVEEGSVIEISYRLRSPFEMYLRDWDFQWDIPALHSEAYIRIPEYFVYHQNMRGYFALTITEEFQESGSLMVMTKGQVVPGSTTKRIAPSSETVNYLINTKHYVANNLPALKEEEFVDNMENYRSSIEFELSYTKFNMKVKPYTTSWDDVTKRLLEAYYFGQKLDKTGFAKDDIENLIANYSDKRELMEAIYTHVQKKVKWNGLTGLTVDGTLREVYNTESGRAADINFILINMLKEAGFNALPVALSTRNNGIILPTFPTMDGFNNMIALVILDGENILLDASSSYCPPGVLPVRCLNGRGRIIDENYNSWIDLEPKGKFEEVMMYDLKIDETGGFSGIVVSSGNDYASIRFREKVEEALSIDKMMEDLEESNPGMEVVSHEISGLDNPFGPVRNILEVRIKERSDFIGDMIIFNPLLFDKISSNPFKLENREHPVNFTYLRDYKYIFKYVLPEGFEVESLPEPLIMANSDKSTRFVYSASQIGNMVTLTVMLNINKVLFLQNEYFELKEFYNLLVAKEAEQIILKKTTNP